MHYFRFHIGDYAKDTAHLSPIEDIAYRRLLDWYYLNEKPINPVAIARLIRMMGHEAEVNNVLLEFFEQDEKGFTSGRADAEILAFRQYGEVKRNAANKRWQSTSNADAMQMHSSSNADAMQMHTTSNADAMLLTTNHKPLTTNHKPVTNIKPTVASLPDWLNGEVWEDFKKHRGKKFTELAQRLTIKNLGDFREQGSDPNKCLENSIANGWTSVQPEKQKGQQNGYVSERSKERKRVIKGLTGYDADAIDSVSQRID